MTTQAILSGVTLYALLHGEDLSDAVDMAERSALSAGKYTLGACDDSVELDTNALDPLIAWEGGAPGMCSTIDVCSHAPDDWQKLDCVSYAWPSDQGLQYMELIQCGDDGFLLTRFDQSCADAYANNDLVGLTYFPANCEAVARTAFRTELIEVGRAYDETIAQRLAS